jgi:hypothetical protein
MRKHAVDPAEPITQPMAEPMTEPLTGPIGPGTPPPARDERNGWRSQVAFVLVLVVLAVGVVRIGLYHWREGAVLVGGALVLAGFFRAVLPPRIVGLLAVRGRLIDVLSYAALAALMLFVALTLTGGPFG